MFTCVCVCACMPFGFSLRSWIGSRIRFGDLDLGLDLDMPAMKTMKAMKAMKKPAKKAETEKIQKKPAMKAMKKGEKVEKKPAMIEKKPAMIQKKPAKKIDDKLENSDDDKMFFTDDIWKSDPKKFDYYMIPTKRLKHIWIGVSLRPKMEWNPYIIIYMCIYCIYVYESIIIQKLWRRFARMH